jgi:hypothetical protein
MVSFGGIMSFGRVWQAMALDLLNINKKMTHLSDSRKKVLLGVQFLL